MADHATLHSLAFAEHEAGDDGLSEPFPVLYAGKFKRSDFGEITVTESDLDKAVENFSALTKDEQGNPEAPIDEDHAFSKGQKAPATGWIKQLVRDGAQLMARVKWTPQAAESIKQGQYRYISPEFTTAWKNEAGESRGFALLSAGLTNRPFLKGLPPVALSEAVQAEIADQVTALAPAVGIELVGDPSAPARKTPAMADEPKTVTLSEAEVTQLRETAGQVATLAETVKGLEEARDNATAALNETKAELRKEQVDKLLSQARREGRIDASDETTAKWHERADKHGVEFVSDLLKEFQADTIPMSERGSGFDKPEVGTAPDGVDADHYAIDARIKAYAAEKNVTYSEAFDVIAAQEAAV